MGITRDGDRIRIAVATFVGLAIEVALVGFGRFVIEDHPDRFGCPPIPGPRSPFDRGLDTLFCAPAIASRWTVVLATYVIGLFVAFVVIDSVAERGPERLLLPASTAFWTASGLLPLYVLASDAGPVAVGIWAGTTIVLPVVLVGLSYMAHPGVRS